MYGGVKPWKHEAQHRVMVRLIIHCGFDAATAEDVAKRLPVYLAKQFCRLFDSRKRKPRI